MCVADRAGEPAGSTGPGSVGVPQPSRRNPAAAHQQDGGQVSIHPHAGRCRKRAKITTSLFWLLSRIKEVSSKPRKEYSPKPRMTLELLPPSESHNGGIHSAKSPGRSPGTEYTPAGQSPATVTTKTRKHNPVTTLSNVKIIRIPPNYTQSVNEFKPFGFTTILCES